MVAIVLVSLIQVHSVMTQMTIFGSAKDEYAARFGFASGTYAKRVMIILWAVAGAHRRLPVPRRVAFCLDPDAVWGIMSLRLLGPGLLGLMVAGLLAANMAFPRRPGRHGGRFVRPQSVRSGLAGPYSGSGRPRRAVGDCRRAGAELGRRGGDERPEVGHVSNFIWQRRV